MSDHVVLLARNERRYTGEPKTLIYMVCLFRGHRRVKTYVVTESVEEAEVFVAAARDEMNYLGEVA